MKLYDEKYYDDECNYYYSQKEEEQIDEAMHALLMIKQAKDMLRNVDLSILKNDDLEEIALTANDIAVMCDYQQDLNREREYKMPGEDEVQKAFNEMFAFFNGER